MTTQLTDPTRSNPSPAPTIRLGLIGPGTRLRIVLDQLRKSEGGALVKIVSAYDPDERSHQKLRQLLGEDYTQASSEEAVWENPDVDWVMIGSWNGLHASQSIRALQAGKNVFCEKPLATTLEDCLAIRDAVDESGCAFAFGLVLRYSTHYQKIREIIDSGRLGTIISMEFNETLAFNHGGHIFGNWRKDKEVSGGHMLEKCCHDLDLANWYADSVPTKVASFGGQNFFVPENAKRIDEIGPNVDGLPAYKSWTTFCNDPHHPFLGGGNVLDNQVVILEYANGIRATFHTNANAAIPERRFYILGSHGSLRGDLFCGTIETASIGWDSTIETLDLGVSDGHGGGDATMSRHLIQTFLGQAPPLASVREGLVSAITAFGIDEACRDSKVVDLVPVWKQIGVLN